MRVMVLGGDGYLGWPLSLHLSAAQHDVAIVDNFVRRDIDHQLGIDSLVPIRNLYTRINTWREHGGAWLKRYDVDLLEYADLRYALIDFRPDTVVHLAEQRSAPYSMMGQQEATYTQRNNVIGTLNLIHAVAEVDPSIHIVKLGTMGEYGTPNIDIEEGWLDIEHNGRRDRMLYPKKAGSWYHLSKVHDSYNLEFACRAWGLCVTDLNQGVVYGHETDQTIEMPELATRLDYDAVFGTVLNRFAVQAAIGHPLTVYGTGTQTRGFISIRDVMQCVELAIHNPPKSGEFMVFNQMTEAFSVIELAKRVARVDPNGTGVRYFYNPRVEQEDHYYNVKHTGLGELGLMPHPLHDDDIADLIETARRYRDRVDLSKMEPVIFWRRFRRPTA
jgi:UDP-sulfoquinovose synthase